ncbi:WD domain, partial [Diplonema papillatum]
GILASASVDFRSSRQGYSGRPYLIAAERISGGELAAGPEGSFARFSVVSNDGTLATWDHTIDGWNLVNSIPSTQGPVSHLAVLRLDVHASEARLPAGIENCIVMLGTTGHLSIYDLLTGAIICKVELMTERGCTSVGLEGLSTTSIVVAGTRPATGDNSHYNFICIVHLGSLRVDELKGRDAESCRLSSVEVSGTKTHLVACHTAEVLEVWDLAGRWLLSKLSYPYTLVTWLPVPKGKNPRNEAFIWLSSDGVMSFFRVKNGEAKPYPTNPSFMQTKKKIIVGFGNPVLTADWFGELLLTGDAAGMMFLVNLKTAKFSYIENHQKSVIKQLSICPTKYIEVAPDVSAAEGQKRRNVCLALVLFEDQEFGVWDIGEKHRMSFSKGPDQKSRSLKATSVGWITGPFPVIATPTGTVTILDLALGSSCSAVTLRSLARPLRTTAFLVRPHAAYLMACLMNGFVDGASNLSSEKPKATSSSAATNDYPENPDSASTYASVQPPYRNAFGELVTKPIKTQADEIVGHLQLVPEHVKDTIRSLSEDEPDDIALRCLIAAAVFAEPTKMEFWRSVAVALKAAKGAPRPRFVHPTIATKNKTQHDAQQQQQQLQQQQRLSNSVSPVGTPPSQDLDPTDAPLEALLDGFTVGAHDELFLDDGLLHAIDCKSTAEKEMAAKASKATIHYATIAQHHVKLGSMTPAVSLLLDTPQDAPEWKANLYKACVVAAGVSTLNYQHTVKRVASMLISNSDIEGAVELLCLIGRGYDACRAYQTHDKWDEAARLAKVSLSASEARDILKRWADHLSSCGETLNAACVLVSCGDFISALRTLGPHAEFCDLAALLAVACDRSGIIEEALPANPELPAFVKSLYLQHKEYLHSISASRIASHYSGLAQECYLRYERAARPPPEVPQEVAQESSA